MMAEMMDARSMDTLLVERRAGPKVIPKGKTMAACSVDLTVHTKVPK